MLKVLDEVQLLRRNRRFCTSGQARQTKYAHHLLQHSAYARFW